MCIRDSLLEMTQAKLEDLLKIDNESYNLLRVLHMFMKLDDTQQVPLQSMAVFWYVATYQNCTKKDIEDVPDDLALDIIRRIPCRHYNYVINQKNNPGYKTVGFIAQEVQSVLPKLVKTNEVLDGTEGFLTVNYHALIAYLIESIKELSARVKVLEAK